jgi:hypothetical protein
LWGSAALEEPVKITSVRSGFSDSGNPFMSRWSGNQVLCGHVHARHLLDIAESAILPSEILVPVNENDGETGNQKKGEGLSTVEAPVLVHSGDIIACSKLVAQIFRVRGKRGAIGWESITG